MEFLRFGSSIPGGYWGCCAVCIIQNFAYDPEDKASIQLVSGDGGNPLIDWASSSSKFAGPTYEDIFKTRLRIGTFSDQDMPNHVFLAVLTEEQIGYNPGKKWLEILKREGFEFIRTTDNSVYTGPSLYDGSSVSSNNDYDDEYYDGDEVSSHKNYIFGLFRNIGQGRVDDTLTPPKVWTDLPDPYNGDMSSDNVLKVQTEIWNKLGPPKFLTEAEVVAAGAPVMLAGRRMPYAAPELKSTRDAREAKPKTATKVDPFAKVA